MKKERGVIAITEIIILVLGIISIGYAVGSEVKLVNAVDPIIIDPDLNKVDPKLGESLSKLNAESSTNVPTSGSTKFESNAATSTAGGSSTASNIFGVSAGSGYDAILSGAQWAVVVFGIVQVGGRMLGFEDYQVNAASIALGAGFGVGKFAYTAVKQGGFLHGWAAENLPWVANNPGLASGAVGLGTAAIIFLMMYKTEDTEIVIFECLPWDAPVGGNDCEKCNDQVGGLPCSEYQCRSLGQACVLENAGTSEAVCVWASKNDVNPPVIEVREDSLLTDYRYTPDNAVSPPDRGVKIEYTQAQDKCVPAFTPLTFGITTDEPSKCKLDYTRKNTFDEMAFFFGGSSTFKYNHTQIMSLPGPSAETNGSLIIQNDGSFEIYSRCQDANGNTNVATFQFSFCVDEGPDTTPPQIVTTNLLNGMPIAFEQEELDLEVYTNEPATCKWSRRDQSYEDMEETMSCSRSVFEMNAQMLYKCSTTLNSLNDRAENNFYFRCEDQPNAQENDRNVNQQSYEFTVVGTQPLVIDSVGPNETIKGSTQSVKVVLEAETSAGYDDGQAFCYFKEEGDRDYIEFVESDSNEHSQELFLTEGDYDYSIRCVDLGGNADEESVSFSVEVDEEAPTVVRTYYEENYLKIITEEKAECVYSVNANLACNYQYADGIKMTTVEETEHYVDWNTQNTVYVKCSDDYGNQPDPDECSIVVRPYKSFA